MLLVSLVLCSAADHLAPLCCYIMSLCNMKELGCRPTQNGAIAKPARKGPNAQSNKGKQSGAPKVLVGTPGIKAPKSITSREEPLKITISNDRTQRINMVRIILGKQTCDAVFTCVRLLCL